MELEITENIKKAISEFDEQIKKLEEKIKSQDKQDLVKKLEKAIKIVEELENEC